MDTGATQSRLHQLHRLGMMKTGMRDEKVFAKSYLSICYWVVPLLFSQERPITTHVQRTSSQPH
jgi:hypothetical protein